MDLKTWCTAERGRSSLLASSLKLPPSFVSQMASGLRPVPIEHCASIEQLTASAVTRQELRPDDWRRIWPELAGADGVPDAESQQLARSHGDRRGTEPDRRQHDVPVAVDLRDTKPDRRDGAAGANHAA